MDNSNVTPLHPKEKNKKEETTEWSSISCVDFLDGKDVTFDFRFI